MSPNILVIMSDNRNIINDINSCDYNTLTAVINYNYCKRHGYNFIYYIPHNKFDFSIYNCFSLENDIRHASWAKLLSTMKSILDFPNYDYILYIDSDCIFNNFDIKIESYFLQLTPLNGKNFYDANLILLNDKPWHPNHPCAGFYILKNNVESFEIFKNWYSIDFPEIKTFNTKHTWEQYALYYIFPKYDKIIILDDWMFEEKNPNQMLRHIGTHEKQNRTPFFKQKIISESLDNNFEEINNNIIIYDTNEIIKKIYEKS